MDERKKHGWPFRIAVVVIVLPLLYVASSGPAFLMSSWISARPGPDRTWPSEYFNATYAPLHWSVSKVESPEVMEVYAAYLKWWYETFRPMLGASPF